MRRRKLLFGALLISACSGELTSVDPLNGPRRGPTPIPREGGGGGDGSDGSATGLDGRAGGSAMTGMGGSDDGGGDSASSNNGGTGGGGGLAIDSAPDVSPPPDAVTPVDSSIGGLTCPWGTNDVSNIGTGNFEIAFRIVTTEKRLMAVLNQRLTCGYGVFWDIRMSSGGTILVEIDGSAADSYELLESEVAVNDGNPHDVIVARAAGKLTIRIDKAVAGQRDSKAKLGALPPLRLDNDVCVDQVTVPRNVPFNGTLSTVCITGN